MQKIENDYHNKERGNHGIVIDRIDCMKGYRIDNIQILSGYDNAVKSVKERIYKQLVKEGDIIPLSKVPF